MPRNRDITKFYGPKYRDYYPWKLRVKDKYDEVVDNLAFATEEEAIAERQRLWNEEKLSSTMYKIDQ